MVKFSLLPKWDSEVHNVLLSPFLPIFCLHGDVWLRVEGASYRRRGEPKITPCSAHRWSRRPLLWVVVVHVHIIAYGLPVMPSPTLVHTLQGGVPCPAVVLGQDGVVTGGPLVPGAAHEGVEAVVGAGRVGVGR